MIDLPTELQAMRPGGALLVLTMIFIAAEYAYARLSHHDEDHDLRETAASVGVALGDFAMRFLTGGLAAIPFFLLYKYRLMDISMSGFWPWAALFLGAEFCYYWFHRAAHRVRWLWATHAVHHSATRFNLSAAIRIGWTGQLTGAFVFFLPLAWIGFHPVAIGAMLGAGLLYQFFLHTAFPVRLGPLEWVLNTPAHHRVHHASNELCLDRNYGNILIVFDRLFGTFATAPTDELLRFGLKNREPSNNVFRIALGEWAHLIRDAVRAKGLRQRLKVLFGAP
ncbi:MAG: sterol desaturase family protein [Pseudomonadota bacterium]|nr:sterol desaturase family protein [Pseudomonadota bacterium]